MPSSAKISQKADLHTHTTASDGMLSPAELIDAAAAAQLRAIAVTDHDTTAGFAEAAARGAELGVEVIPAIEMSARADKGEVHILGYFVDPADPKLNAHVTFSKNMRLSRAYAILHKLDDHGHPLSIKSVLGRAGNSPIGRPHIAEAMVQQGVVSSYNDAFNRWIGDGRPAFVEKHNATPAEVIALIHRAGGVAVLAHPGPALSHDALYELAASGLDGIEVVHPRHRLSAQKHLRQLAQTFDLLTTGGSDFHGGRKENEALGDYVIAYKHVENLRARHERRLRELAAKRAGATTLA